MSSAELTTVSNVDQLRSRIDSGETGDKVAFADFAAAPLGTDAEAGGHSPTRQEIGMDVASQAGAGKHQSHWNGDAIGVVAYGAAVGLITTGIWAIVLVSGYR